MLDGKPRSEEGETRSQVPTLVDYAKLGAVAIEFSPFGMMYRYFLHGILMPTAKEPE